MANRDLIVVGASAGGIEALGQVLPELPRDLPASVLVVVHMAPTGGRSLQAIMARWTEMQVVAAEDARPLEPGCLYACVGDHHLLVGDGHVHLRQGPRENGHRPAADPLFRSAAAYFGPRAIGVILSGSLSDGTAGLVAIRGQGGRAVVQDPADALYSGMPASAIEYVGADHVLPAAGIGPLLVRLVGEEVDGPVPVPGRDLRREVGLMEQGDEVVERAHPGAPSPWPCPDCNGVLWAIEDGPLLRFRCRVGHAWTAESLLQEQGEGVEAALWMALRALEDRADLCRTLAERAEEAGRRLSATRFRSDVAGLVRSIGVLRLLLNSDAGPRSAGEVPAQGSGNG